MTKSFEEFEVHKKGVLLTKQVYQLIKNSAFEKEYDFKSQIKRAVYSITNNIAEGSEYNSNRQFVKFLKISKGSCGEVRNMLVLARELGFSDDQKIKVSYDLSIEISQNLSNFINYLQKNIDNKG
ncbi:MAG TPA: four helix bundle protein [Flavobacterium sp.]|jgi:four helix bundle protein